MTLPIDCKTERRKHLGCGGWAAVSGEAIGCTTRNDSDLARPQINGLDARLGFSAVQGIAAKRQSAGTSYIRQGLHALACRIAIKNSVVLVIGNIKPSRGTECQAEREQESWIDYDWCVQTSDPRQLAGVWIQAEYSMVSALRRTRSHYPIRNVDFTGRSNRYCVGPLDRCRSASVGSANNLYNSAASNIDFHDRLGDVVHYPQPAFFINS